MIKITEQTAWVFLGLVAILAIVVPILLFQMDMTGQAAQYMSAEEACALFVHSCDDGLPPIPTGNIDYKAQLVECRCQTNPYHLMWRSMLVTPWKR